MTRSSLPALTAAILLSGTALVFAQGSPTTPQHDTEQNRATTVAPPVPDSAGGAAVRPQAAKPSPGGMSEQQIRAALEQQGFVNVGPFHVTEKGDTYTATAFRNDRKLQLEINPQTGTITHEATALDTGGAAAAGQSGTSAQQARVMSEQELESHLKQQGYTSIGMIKLKGDTYEARADKNGKSVAIEVDARTGKVVSEGPEPRT